MANLEFITAAPPTLGVVLAIETSCDETSIAIIRDGALLAHKVASQDELHRRYGGVVPEIASRRHLEVVHPLIENALEDAGIGFGDLKAIAVTHGPGLIGAVLVGVAVAKSLALALKIPLIGVNHVEGHIYSPLLDHPEMQAPWISLVVSGGHTMIAVVRQLGQIEILGKTRDDAAGEAFDKVAKMLGLGYPGGPLVAKMAEKGDARKVDFPRPMMHEGLGFSFSGLKTSVHHQMSKNPEITPEDLCASFQEAVVDVLVHKTLKAAEQENIRQVSLVGGVAANRRLREVLEKRCAQKGLSCHIPSFEFCTDNAAMIGLAGTILLKLGVVSSLTLDAHASLSFRDWTSLQSN
jgi:N6-L-threonylcarbamoyladenine synthase